LSMRRSVAAVARFDNGLVGYLHPDARVKGSGRLF
jgi:hypothetical protein